jgi:hypothetical protein
MLVSSTFYGQSFDDLNKKIDSLNLIVEDVNSQINEKILLKDNLLEQINELTQKRIKLDFEKESLEGFITTTRFMGGSLRDKPGSLGKVIAKIPPEDTILIFNWYYKPYFNAEYEGLVGYISSGAIVPNEKINSIISLTLTSDQQIKSNELSEMLREMDQKSAQEEKDWAEKKQQLLKENEAALAKRKQELISRFGQSNGSRILSGEYWIGMTDEMAIASVGYPDDINRTNGSWGVHEQWVYSGKGLYLYFEDGKLTSFQN